MKLMVNEMMKTLNLKLMPSIKFLNGSCDNMNVVIVDHAEIKETVLKGVKWAEGTTVEAVLMDFATIATNQTIKSDFAMQGRMMKDKEFFKTKDQKVSKLKKLLKLMPPL